MDRYLYTEITGSNLDERQVQAYQSTRYPILDPTSEDTYIRTRTGDRLDNLAYEYYQDAGLWWIIALVNNLGKGTLSVPPANQLRIPSQKIINNLLTELQQAQQE